MGLKLKRTGQRSSGYTPLDGAGEHHANVVRRAVCNCGGKVIEQKHVFPGGAVQVTYKRRRSVPATA